MIQANELRIGNWVNIQGEFDSQIHSIENGRLWCKDGDQMISSTVFEFQPIPLTPEVLEKCGFEWSVYHQAWHKTGFVFDLSERHTGGYYMHISRNKTVIVCPEILHLHQLQNLYFALTGEELEYKP